MQIWGLLDIDFDSAVVFPTNSLILFRLALAILCNLKTMRKIAPDFCSLLRINELYEPALCKV